jgi:hypothetical protein
LPTSTGLDLGSTAGAGQRWDLFAQTVDISTSLTVAGTTTLSGSINDGSALPATAGTVRFGTGGTIQWRNNANTQNLSLRKDTADVLHWPGILEIDCGGAGEPTCSGGLSQIVLSDNNNPGVNGNGYFIRWGQRNSAGTPMNPTQLQGGFADATAGSEQATLDWAVYVGGVVQGIGIGGVVGGGAVPAITPANNGVWQLGRSGKGFLLARMDGSNPSIEFRNTAATLPNGLHRIIETGNDLVFNRNTSAGGAFATNTNDLVLSGVTGDVQIGTGVSADGGGAKHKRFGASCTTAAGIGSTCTNTYSWTTTFADANYTPVCWGQAGSNFPILYQSSFNAAGVTITVAAMTAAAAQFASVDCIALHD